MLLTATASLHFYSISSILNNLSVDNYSILCHLHSRGVLITDLTKTIEKNLVRVKDMWMVGGSNLEVMVVMGDDWDQGVRSAATKLQQ